MEINRMIDHTKLGANVSKAQIDQLIEEAKTYHFKSVCVNPIWVKYAKHKLNKTDVLVCTVIGFPHGTHHHLVKAYETLEACNDGADEIDMVINVYALKAKDYHTVEQEIKGVVESADQRTVKVIIETCYLTDEEVVKACEIAVEQGATFVKTSTGFGTGGATIHHVELMKKTVGEKAFVKASGGVRTYEDAMKMIKAGATRIGTSNGIDIMTKRGEKMIPTPHINLEDKSLIAKTVLMPGDPLRAKFIADTFLTKVVEINNVRNMFGYTGYYGKKKVTVMGSGMGMPSIGIYSYELYNFYEVEKIIRIGSAGAYSPELKLYDVLLVEKAYSESSYAKTMGVSNRKILNASKPLNNRILKASEKLEIPVKLTTIHSSDVFYRLNHEEFKDIYKNFGAEAVEMESFALFANAKALKKKAACLLTVSDSLITHEATTALERQEAFTKMMEVALNSI